jgi:hypothetical protein
MTDNTSVRAKGASMQNTIIDVSGLPDPVIRDIQQLVQTIRDKVAMSKPTPAVAPLPLWEGVVLGRMERRELYEDGR